MACVAAETCQTAPLKFPAISKSVITPDSTRTSWPEPVRLALPVMTIESMVITGNG